MSVKSFIDNKLYAISIRNPWTNTYGLARSLLAIGTLSTLIFNDVDLLFRPATGLVEVPLCQGISKFGLFCLLSDNIVVAKIISIIILLLVLSGIYPRLTGLPHWWVSFSYATSAILVDGGDQVTSVLCLILVPVCLTDSRKFHWTIRKVQLSHFLPYKSLIAQSSIVIIRIQMAIIYLNAAFAKVQVTEWINGTALYYWLSHPTFGVADWLKPLINPILTNGFLVTTLTWGVILLELLLFTGLVIDKKYRTLLLGAGLFFHFSIILAHGLFSFFFAMAGGLFIYLGPVFKGYDCWPFNKQYKLFQI